MRRRRVLMLGATVAVVLAVAIGFTSPASSHNQYEVWAIDQSDSPGKTYGGTLYIWDGHELEKRRGVRNHDEDQEGDRFDAFRWMKQPKSERIDLGEEVSALCLARTGANPVRPHMITVNPAQTHVIISFVATGHVLFIEADSREPVECIRTSPGVGGVRQAHMATPSPDGTYVTVANPESVASFIRSMRRPSPFRVSLLVAVAVWAATVPESRAQSPTGLPHFGTVSHQLYRGAQPANAGFAELKKLGIDIVVNLRHETDWIARERTLVEAQGMRYVSIPWRGKNDPNTEQVAQFLGLLRDNPERKVFVHCQRGAERTGVMVACYRMSREHWTADKAVAEMEAFRFRAGRFEHLERFVREFPTLLLSDRFLKSLARPVVEQ